jgi:hypothetical protein
MVSRWYRVMPGLAVLMAMLGLPIASILCDLACPRAGASGVHAERPVARTVAAGADAPCHEATASTARPADVAPAPVATASLPRHDCDHPTVLSTRRTADGVRLDAPFPTIAVAPTPLVDPQAIRSSGRARTTQRPPAAGTLGAFSPVLRI